MYFAGPFMQDRVTVNPPETPEQGKAPGLLGLFDRSWELELLISGFLSFGLVSAANGLVELDNLQDAQDFFAGYNEAVAFIARAGLFIGSGVLMGLAVTFLAHLCLRGFWVSLIGLENGVPARARMEVLARKRPALARLVERKADVKGYIAKMDRLCSNLFSIGFVNALVLISLFIFAAIIVGALALTYGIRKNFFEEGAIGYFLYLVTVVLSWLVSLSIVIHIFWFTPFRFIFVNRKPFGLRKKPGKRSRFRRRWRKTKFARFLRKARRAFSGLLLARTLDAYYYYFVAYRDAKLYWLYIPSLAGFFFQMAALGNSVYIVNGSYEKLPGLVYPAEPPQSVNAPLYHYAESRSPAVVKSSWAKDAPFIESQAVGGDKAYLRIYVPFSEQLSRLIPDSLVPPDEAANARQRELTLPALTRALEISVDDSQRSPVFRYQRIPIGEGFRPGLTAFLSAKEMREGEHVLDIRYRAGPDSVSRSFAIPFFVY